MISFFLANQACKGNRPYQIPRIGVSDDKVAQYASLHYYVDKELQVCQTLSKQLPRIEDEYLFIHRFKFGLLNKVQISILPLFQNNNSY